MDHSCQSLHGLPILNYENDDVSRKAKWKNFKDIHENNRAQFVRNMRKNGPQMEKTYVKNSKTKWRRNSANHKNLKKTWSICSTYIKRLIRARSPTNSSRSRKKRKTPIRQTNQIKVLFSSEAQKLKNKRSNLNQDLIKDIYDFNAFNYDTVDERQNTSIVNLKNRQNLVCYEIPKQKREVMRKHYTINRVNNDNMRKPSPKSSHNYDIQSHYKVVQFPNFDQTDTELEAINMGKKFELSKFEYQTQNVIDLQKQVDSPKPCVSNDQRGGGDACSVSIQCLDPKENRIKHKKSNNDDFDHFLNPLIIYENALCLAKVTLKYLIFGLALIVWSPCIITLYLCWLVTFPLRPNNSQARNSRCRKKSQAKLHVRGSKHVTDNCVQTCENDIRSIILKGISHAYQPIAVSFGAFKSLLNPNTNNLHCYSANERSGNKGHVMTSDPGKKYTLYYSRTKGWIMKSSKRRSKKSNNISCNLNEVSKVTYEPHCFQRIKDSNRIDIGSQYPHGSCRIHAGKYTIVKNKKKYLQSCSPSRHKHLCADKSGLPVFVKLLPMFNNNVASKQRNLKSVKKSKSADQEPKRCPEQQYKNPPKCKGLLKQKPKLKLRNRIWQCCNEIKTVINDVETEIFGNSITCKSIYIHTLRRTPGYYLFKNCPSFYPIFLGVYKFYENMCHFFLLFISACIWCPLFVFCYLFYAIICKSL